MTDHRALVRRRHEVLTTRGRRDLRPDFYRHPLPGGVPELWGAGTASRGWTR